MQLYALTFQQTRFKFKKDLLWLLQDQFSGNVVKICATFVTKLEFYVKAKEYDSVMNSTWMNNNDQENSFHLYEQL